MSKIYQSIFLALVLAFSSVIHFTYLSSGTPSWEKNLQIFGTKEKLDQYIKPMIELREKYYLGLSEMLDPSKSEENSKEIYKKIFLVHEQIPFFGQIPEWFILSRIRGYLIGVLSVDDQYPMKAISNLNPKKLDFNPNIYAAYGGFYYYTGGFFLLLGKFFKVISLTPDISYYFSHPEETQKMYQLMRSIGGFSFLATLLVIFFWIKSVFDLKTASFSTLTLALTPGIVPLSHGVKAHLYGAFLFTLGLYFFLKLLYEPHKKNFMVGAVFLGLCASSIITNLSVIVVVVLTEWAYQDWKFLPFIKSKRLWTGLMIVLGIYLLTNFYIFADIGGFKKTIWSLKEYTKSFDEYGKINLINGFIYLKYLLVNQVSWLGSPLFILGCASIIKKKYKPMIVCLLIMSLLLFVDMCTTRHYGINSKLIPIYSIFIGLGIRWLMENISGWRKIICLAYCLFFFFLSGLQTIFYLKLYKEPSNLSLAGQWINSNITQNETIGLVSAQLSQASSPPFHFLEYQLIHLPPAFQYVPNKNQRLPSYIITTEKEHPILNSNYKLIKSWLRLTKLFFIPFQSDTIFSGNIDLYIFKKELS